MTLKALRTKSTKHQRVLDDARHAGRLRPYHISAIASSHTVLLCAL
eukprot:CAMPEP_0184398182 /NCGR_PEP_ID=MMETSP0007-20130409/64455_1 /TAXON_ID=97485 /ORGANISM="Prymnesium parvum, Strain Texoma1" /LENGTH=45 /DNA_ID= /DNA_START= /DNA_END= /DNA_ORIENTATION=